MHYLYTRKHGNKMPYATKGVGHHKVKVFNAKTGHVFAKHTTKETAAKQERLLRALDHGRKPRGGKK